MLKRKKTIQGIILFSCLFGLYGCNNEKVKESPKKEKEVETTQASEQHVSNEEYITQAIELLEKGNLASNQKNLEKTEEIWTLNEFYESAERMTQFDIEEETEFEKTPYLAPNKIRTGKFIEFKDKETMKTALKKKEESFLVDGLGVNTDEVNPTLISNEQRGIVLQINGAIEASKMEKIQNIIDDLAELPQ